MVTLYPEAFRPAEQGPNGVQSPAKPRMVYTPHHSCRITEIGQLEITVTIDVNKTVTKLLPVAVLVDGKKEAVLKPHLEKIVAAFEKSGALAAVARTIYERTRVGDLPHGAEFSLYSNGQVAFDGKELLVARSQNLDQEGLLKKSIQDVAAAVKAQKALLPPAQQLAANDVSFVAELGLAPAQTIVDDDDEEPKLSYADVKKEVTALTLMKKDEQRKKVPGLLLRLKEVSLGDIYADALKANDTQFLVFLQKRGCVDEDGITPLHCVCEQPASKEQVVLAKKLIEVSTKGQLRMKEKSLLKTAFVVAIEKGHLEIAKLYRKKDKMIMSETSKYGNVPLQSLVTVSRPPANRAEMAAFLIKKSTIELLNKKSESGKTALESALQHGYADVVDALLQPLISGLASGKDPSLVENLWNIVTGFELQSQTVKLIVGGLKKAKTPFLQALYKRFFECAKSAELEKIKPLETLRYAFILERNFAANVPVDPAKLMKDIVKAPLHPFGVERLVEEMGASLKKPGEKESQKAIQAICGRYEESIALGKRTKTLTPYEALVSAFITEYEVVKVSRVAEEVFQAQGGLLPKGWQILKEKQHIFVVTGHVLGAGTFKKASVAMQFVLQPNLPPRMEQETQVYLNPLENASMKDKEEMRHEAQVFKKLEGMPGICRCFIVRVADLDDVGMLVEHCESDVEKLLEDRTYLQRTPAKERLELFHSIVEGVQSMHSKDLVHADFKPGNCLIRGGKAKITDFGTTFEKGKEASKAVKSGFHSTPMYTSYELYASKGNFPPNFDPFTIDLSALGDILKLLYDGKPFDFMQKLDDAAALRGLKPALGLPKGAQPMTTQEYQAQLQEEIVAPLQALIAKGAGRSIVENQKFHFYSLIASCKGIHPLHHNEKPTAQIILQRAAAVLQTV